MPSYVALLRGVNVGGRKVAMAGLRDTFAQLGHTEVRTYIQSGNVVFTTTKKPASVRRALETAIAGDFGLDVTVLLRTAAELARVIQHNPYGPGAYVTFLDGAPEASKVKAIDPAPYSPDEFTVRGSEIYVNCPNGYGRTKINNNFFERKLAMRATTRNMKTVTVLHEWAQESS